MSNFWRNALKSIGTIAAIVVSIFFIKPIVLKIIIAAVVIGLIWAWKPIFDFIRGLFKRRSEAHGIDKDTTDTDATTKPKASGDSKKSTSGILPIIIPIICTVFILGGLFLLSRQISSLPSSDLKPLLLQQFSATNGLIQNAQVSINDTKAEVVGSRQDIATSWNNTQRGFNQVNTGISGLNATTGAILENTGTIMADNKTILGNTGTIMADNKTILGNTGTIMADNKTILGNTGTIMTDTKTVLGNTGTIMTDTKTVLGNTGTIMTDTKTVLGNTGITTNGTNVTK